ncbi:hypothetical protein KI387_006670 [Taxus chinensis]|uniref:Uncharacterized protein n=1 Tax=Taxus chinensis TaxID=29808 RepID=A0AA38GQH5_TAXCH|nr:hypothetical protein KI387_006670 [Taxus chinensis]
MNWQISKLTHTEYLNVNDKLSLLKLEEESTTQPITAMETEAETEASANNFKTCKRCKSTFDPFSNSSSSCRFHPSFFVSRRHDDQKRYYELGPDDPPYAAKFYDCCGAEESEAAGCMTSFHISYDDI